MTAYTITQVSDGISFPLNYFLCTCWCTDASPLAWGCSCRGLCPRVHHMAAGLRDSHVAEGDSSGCGWPHTQGEGLETTVAEAFSCCDIPQGLYYSAKSP